MEQPDNPESLDVVEREIEIEEKKTSEGKTVERSEEEEEEERIALSKVKSSIRRVYSSTSTVYAQGTIGNPNSGQILFCIASILQAQVYEDQISCPTVEQRNLAPEFNFIPQLSPELGGVCEVSEEVLDRESRKDEMLRAEMMAGTVPSVNCIYRFISFLHNHAKYPAECNIVALVYINRMTASIPMVVTQQNWRLLWVISIIIAQKMWDDYPMKTSNFASFLPGILRQTLLEAEVKALNLLQFNTGVVPSLYAKYYFELRQLYVEVVGGTPWAGSYEKPLSLRSEMLLQDRSTRKLAVPSTNVNSTPSTDRSGTVSSAAGGSSRSPLSRLSSGATSPSSGSLQARKKKGSKKASSAAMKQTQTLEDATPLRDGTFYVIS